MRACKHDLLHEISLSIHPHHVRIHPDNLLVSTEDCAKLVSEGEDDEGIDHTNGEGAEPGNFGCEACLARLLCTHAIAAVTGT